MFRFSLRGVCAASVLFAMTLITAEVRGARPTLDDVRKSFAKPSVEFSSGPLWVWNDLMTDEEVISTLRDLHEQHVYHAYVHPRPGLMTSYLSEEWFRLWSVALNEAEKLGMKLWIYDENSYPSGFAGGNVPDQMPSSVQKGFRVKLEPLPTSVGADTLAVFEIKGDKATDVTTAAREEKLTSGSYLTVNLEKGPSAAWYGGKTYVDLLQRQVTDKFLDVTHEAYRKHFGDKFGKLILGSFTDEPNIRIHSLAWTPGIFELFKTRWGYDLRPQLASLFCETGDWKRVRHNYFQLLNELFTENWAKPYYEYCQRTGLEVTGHYWDHEWPNVTGVPDNMAMYSWEQRPSIDCLMNQYREDTHGQFGNSRMPRELSSVANQMGTTRTLCEIYGAGGWELTFQDQKRIADWLAVLGVNTFNQHLSYVTIRGARKRDHPQSFSYHAPYWKDYHVMADYLARLSVVASQGEQQNEILLLQPTTTAYIYQSEEPKERLMKMGNAFQNLHIALERAQVCYDMGSEYVLEKHGSVKGAHAADGQTRLHVGKRAYHTVVIPPHTENLNRFTVDLLKQFTQAGGKVLLCGDPPALIDGKVSDELSTGSALVQKWQLIQASEVPKLLAQTAADDFRINWRPENNGILFHQKRQFRDGAVVLMVNTSMDTAASGTWNSNATAAERWNLEDGSHQAEAVEKSGKGISGRFSIPPCGSLVLALGKATVAPLATGSWETSNVVPLSGPMKVARLSPNVLPIDYVDLECGGEPTKGAYFFKAAQKAFRKNGLKENPWEHAVQFRDEIMKTVFAEQSPMKVTYRFTVAEKLPDELAIAIERADLFTVTCNDQPVTSGTEWWLDRAFAKIDLSRVAKVGENRVEISSPRFSVWHEIEPAYVLGNFSVEPANRGFVLKPAAALQVGSWKEQGMPLYGDAVSYRAAISVANLDSNYAVQLGNWSGTEARVKVNGKNAGIIGWAPWTCDITQHLKNGENEIEVQVVGSLKNPLGPHHNGKGRGSAWPKMFQAGPAVGPPAGNTYDTLDYGLMEPFRVVRATR